MLKPEMFKTISVGPTNDYLLKLLDGYLLVDTSLPSHFPRFLREIGRVNVDLSEIKYLLLTHAHDDHVGLAAEIKARTHCRIVAHENSTEALRAGRILTLGRFLNRRVSILMTLYSWAKRRNFGYAPVPLDDRDIIVAGKDEGTPNSLGLRGCLIPTPGHSRDSLSVVLESGDAFVGDACMSSFGFLHLRPPIIDDLDLVFASWRTIIESGAKTIHPGHGKPFSVEQLVHFREKYRPGCPKS